jgi:hypothetical protein
LPKIEGEQRRRTEGKESEILTISDFKNDLAASLRKEIEENRKFALLE